MKENPPRRWYLLLAVVILIVAGALLAGLWQLPRLFPQLAAQTSTPTASATLPPATSAASATATVPSPVPSLTPSPSPSATPSPAPQQQLQITSMKATANDASRTIVFQVSAAAPAGQQIAEALLWYDTQAGHEVRRFVGPLPAASPLTYDLSASQEGLTTTLPAGELDYWWLVRDTAGAAVRAGGTVQLGPALQAIEATPAPTPPPINFTWAVSESKHFKFEYVPGTEAKRDMPRLRDIAEAGLAYITPTLQLTATGQITMFLTPRVFWQGGATYAHENILISYLDRNYTGVETWSYFTHEGTHALAQRLVQPKPEGGPDGVLVEGLAVWATGGHYRIEPIDDWAAAIAASNQYIPLAKLRAGPFYDYQHEISYMEAASFDKYLIDHYGLPAFKQLYGQETGKADHDDALMKKLYGRDYAQLEQDWLAYLRTLKPTQQETDEWWFQVRTFDLMRSYETALDPAARILPGPPTEWNPSTILTFTHRLDAPANIVFETALIAAQLRADQGDLAGGQALLNDVQVGLDAKGALVRPSLEDRQGILNTLAAQDRAVRIAGAAAYRSTLTPDYARSVSGTLSSLLQPPFIEYRQEVVRLDVADDGQSAQGLVQLHAQVAGGGTLPDNEQLFAVRFVKSGGTWLMAGRERTEPDLRMPPARRPATQ